jgi:hypothetical protein
VFVPNEENWLQTASLRRFLSFPIPGLTMLEYRLPKADQAIF